MGVTMLLLFFGPHKTSARTLAPRRAPKQAFGGPFSLAGIPQLRKWRRENYCNLDGNPIKK
jgi:hypothetical protein